MNDKPFKVGIVGCGVIAPVHIDSYKKCSGVEVKAICDLREDRISELQKRYPDDLFDHYTSYKEMLFDKELDAISICTDHASHSEIFVDAIKAGKHVLCEKALSQSKEKLEQILAAGKSTDRVVSGIFQHRFDPINPKLKEIIEQGAIGRVLTASVEHNCYRSNDYYSVDKWRGTFSGEGGSLLINQSIHFIDILQWVMGGVSSIQAEIANLNHAGVIETEDTAAVTFRFANGSIGTLTATSGSHRSWDAVFHFVGTEGDIVIANGALKSVSHKDAEKEKRLVKALSEDLADEEDAIGKTYYGSSHPSQIADFVRAVRSKRKPFVGIEDAAETNSLVFAIYESARSGNRVWVHPEA